MKSSLLFTLLAAASFQASNAQVWPRPESLVFFAPFDVENGFINVAKDENPSFTASPILETTKVGPLGIANSSYTVGAMGSYIGYYNNQPAFPSFTFSTYFYVSGQRSRGGIVWVYPERFSLIYNQEKLEIHGFSHGIKYSIDSFTVDNVFDGWTFIGLTYDSVTKTLTIFNQYGNQIFTKRNFTIPNVAQTQLYLGYARGSSSDVGMSKGDAVACTMIYNEVLTSEEIAYLSKVCYFKGGPPTPWPEAKYLLGLWPLSDQYKLNNVISDKFNPGNSFKTGSLVHGPHGTADTAIKATSINEPVLEVRDSQLSTNDSSFTVSFYFRAGSDSSSGFLFEFIDSKYATIDKNFRISYNGDTITLTANRVIGNYKMIQRKSTWTFLSFVFDAETTKLSVFSEHGMAYAPTEQPYLWTLNNFNNGGFKLGYSTLDHKGMNPGDAVSCFSMYSKALNWPQIKQLQQACRVLQGSVPSGTPKLSLAPIPSLSKPPLTTVPMEGQFPWLGILETEEGSLVCTVSILDEYWVLTSANCFSGKNSNDFTYRVKVGVQDDSVGKYFTKVHEVAKFIISGTSERDIAMIQLNTPIDFTSEYVNDACLYDGDSLKIEVFQPQYVNGWGSNGRNAFVKKSLPRFVTGTIMPDDFCSKAWAQEYDPNMDFCFKSLTQDQNVPCKGDEGSPLMFQGVSHDQTGIGKRLIQVGLFYKRDEACSNDLPGLFVDIHLYQEWINQQMACALPGSNHQPVQCPQE